MRIAIASKKEMLIEAISHVLSAASEFEISGVIRSLDDSSELFELLRCEVIILTDPGFECSTLNALLKLQASSQKKPVVLVTCSTEIKSAALFFRNSVRAILTKGSRPDELYTAITAAANGKPYVTSVIAQALAHDVSRSNDREIRLSPREEEVIRYIAQGASTSEIARVLQLSTKTVSTHKRSIKSRLNLRGTSEIVQYAIENGFLASD